METYIMAQNFFFFEELLTLHTSTMKPAYKSHTHRELKRLRKGLARVTRERNSFMSQMLEWRWTCMELTHGHHFMARMLAVVDGPDGMCNALAYHMPQKTRDKIGVIIARCHDEQFRLCDRMSTGHSRRYSKAGYLPT